MIVAVQPVNSTPHQFSALSVPALSELCGRAVPEFARHFHSPNGTPQSRTHRNRNSHPQALSIHAITNSLSLSKTSTPLESSKSTLLRKNTGGGGTRKIRLLKSIIS